MSQFLQAGKKAAAVVSIVSMFFLSGCTTQGGIAFMPQVDLQGKSVGMYVSNEEPVTDAIVDNSEEGWTPAQKFLLGAAIVGVAAVGGYAIYNANKNDAVAAPPAKKKPTCPPGTTWNGISCI